MTILLTTLRACAAALLLAGSAAAFASTPAGDDPVATLQAAYARSVKPGEQADLHRDLVATVLGRVQRSYAHDVDLPAFVAAAMKVLEPLPAAAGEPAQVFARAINAGLGTLDPYSRYLDPKAYGNVRSEWNGSFGGLGLQVEAGDGVVRVVSPMPDGPAARAGLLAGDLILRLDDQPLAGVPLSDAIARMRGQPGTPIAITIRRPGVEQEFTVSVTRDTIRRQVLRWNMEGDVLVLRLSSFTGPVAAALEQAIAEATRAHAPRGVVLDMRGNGGGLLREAVSIADVFLRDGEIVSLRGRSGASQRSWKAEPAELLAGVPMVVLVDARSASATELVAAALQEHGRATVMGQRSFGKGTVQSTFVLGEHKGALKLTTSTYHGPSGRSVQKTGVTPDIELLGPATKAASSGDTAQAAKVRVDQARCAAVLKQADPGLSCAVDYVRAEGVDAFLASLPPPLPVLRD